MPDSAWGGPSTVQAAPVVPVTRVASSRTTSCQLQPTFRRQQSFREVFGLLGIPMIACFFISALVSFGFALMQCFPLEAMNLLMHTSALDNGHFWIAAEPPAHVVVLATVALALFGVGYFWLILFVVFFRHRVAVESEIPTLKQAFQRRVHLGLQSLAMKKKSPKRTARNRIAPLVVLDATESREPLSQEQKQDPRSWAAWLNVDTLEEFTSITGAYHHYYVRVL